MSDRQDNSDRVLESHRTFNYGSGARPASIWEDPYGSTEEILNVLDNPRYASLKWRYFRDKETEAFQKVARAIPIPVVLNYAKTLMRPIYTDFTETTENKDFSKISGKFYYYLFIHESIYVSYELFKDAEIRVTKDVKKSIMEKIKKNKYDLGLKISDNEYDDSVEFMHIETSTIVKIYNWEEYLAHVRGSCDYLDNFINGFNIATIELMLTTYFEQCIRLVGKRLEVTTDVNSAKAVSRLEAMLNTMAPFIEDNMNSSTLIHPIKIMEGKDLDSLKDSIYHYLDRMKYEYGRVSNTNPKGERLTSGENYKDISSIANRQKETLEQLIEFAYQAEDLGGQQLEFAVSGIPEKEAIYTVAHRAQNPNMEKEFFGQIEGTAPRVPKGKPTPK